LFEIDALPFGLLCATDDDGRGGVDAEVNGLGGDDLRLAS
jgi:hypothetical protein